MNRQQFTDLVTSHQHPLRRYLTALCCGDSALADDLAQDAFIKAYLSIDKLSDPTKFKSWLFQIAHNTFISNRRSHRMTDDLAVADNIDSTKQSDDRFKYQGLYMALNQLNPKERSSILLHYMQGYSIDEIADITDSTAAAVKQQLSRGRQHLKTLIER